MPTEGIMLNRFKTVTLETKDRKGRIELLVRKLATQF